MKVHLLPLIPGLGLSLVFAADQLIKVDPEGFDAADNQLRWTNGSRRQQFVVLIFVSVSSWLTLTLAAVGHVIWRLLGLLVNGRF